MSMFESITRAKLKDCVIDSNSMLIFIVEENEMGRAIGKGGQNVRRLERMLNRKIKIVEFNSQAIQFVQNLIYPLTPKEIKEEDGNIIIIGKDTKTKGLLIGRDSRNLKNYNSIVKRFIDIDELKVR